MPRRLYQKIRPRSSASATAAAALPHGRHRGAVSSGRHRGAPASPEPRLPFPDRLVWGGLSFGLAGVLWLAYRLSPEPAGMGTHQQLGLPPCSFLVATSLPCPGCGLTTSFAHMAQLEFLSALRVHPIGALMFVLCCLALPLSVVGTVRALPLAPTLSQLHAYRLAVGIAVLALVHWFVRLATMWLA